MSKAMLVLAGPPGGGKSTAALQAAPGSLFVGSAPNNAHYFKQWKLTPEGQAAAVAPPLMELIIDQCSVSVGGKVQMTIGANGLPVPIPQKSTFEMYVGMMQRKAFEAFSKGQPPPWNYVIIDELGTFWNRIFAEIAPTVVTKEGKPNPLGAFGVMGDWSSSICNSLRQLIQANVGIMMVCHDQEPDKANEKKGGPKLPSQAIMRQLCADADGVLFRSLVDPKVDIDNPGKVQQSRRIWRAHASEHWVSKLRGLPDSMFAEIEDWPLKRIIEAAGFDS